MNDQQLMFLSRELFQGSPAAARIEKIAHQHHQSRMRKESRERAGCCQQVSLAIAGDSGKKIKQAEDLLAPPTDRQRQAQSGRKRRAAHAVEIFKTDVTQGGGDLLGVID